MHQLHRHLRVLILIDPTQTVELYFDYGSVSFLFICFAFVFFFFGCDLKWCGVV